MTIEERIKVLEEAVNKLTNASDMRIYTENVAMNIESIIANAARSRAAIDEIDSAIAGSESFAGLR
ncbi:hypothetical protein GWD52_21245 [Enterobacteriaceae bacterium 4M9]|nr:hypothetical protein [Enterobacteriaceae bacterium 4M9]